jgi:ABC-type multidrug transport system fused ATPase/permease subunit
MTVALVRALVKGSKVLLLDEATSSVDPETDALIQRIIQSRLKDITVRRLWSSPSYLWSSPSYR